MRCWLQRSLERVRQRGPCTEVYFTLPPSTTVNWIFHCTKLCCTQCTTLHLNWIQWRRFSQKKTFFLAQTQNSKCKFWWQFCGQILDAKIWGEMRNGRWGLPEKITFSRLIGNSKQQFTVEVWGLGLDQIHAHLTIILWKLPLDEFLISCPYSASPGAALLQNISIRPQWDPTLHLVFLPKWAKYIHQPSVRSNTLSGIITKVSCYGINYEVIPFPNFSLQCILRYYLSSKIDPIFDWEKDQPKWCSKYSLQGRVLLFMCEFAWSLVDEFHNPHFLPPLTHHLTITMAFSEWWGRHQSPPWDNPHHIMFYSSALHWPQVPTKPCS